METLETLHRAALDAVTAASSPADLEQLRVEYLGKKGALTGLLKSLGQLSAEERPKAGAKINVVKEEITTLINQRRRDLEAAAMAQKLASESIDVTLPGRHRDPGGLHPITRAIQRVEDFFLAMIRVV